MSQFLSPYNVVSKLRLSFSDFVIRCLCILASSKTFRLLIVVVLADRFQQSYITNQRCLSYVGLNSNHWGFPFSLDHIASPNKLRIYWSAAGLTPGLSWQSMARQQQQKFSSCYERTGEQCCTNWKDCGCWRQRSTKGDNAGWVAKSKMKGD